MLSASPTSVWGRRLRWGKGGAARRAEGVRKKNKPYAYEAVYVFVLVLDSALDRRVGSALGSSRREKFSHFSYAAGKNTLFRGRVFPV
jgi:hypothetical protein